MDKPPMLAALLIAAGCAPAPQPSLAPAMPANQEIVNDVVTAAAAQVRPCYRSPRVAQAGRQIVTRLTLRMNPDGTLAALPQVASQSGVTPDNQAYAGRMAEAAVLAVMRCAPLRLPPEHYSAIWREFDLVFSPSAAA